MKSVADVPNEIVSPVFNTYESVISVVPIQFVQTRSPDVMLSATSESAQSKERVPLLDISPFSTAVPRRETLAENALSLIEPEAPIVRVSETKVSVIAVPCQVPAPTMPEEFIWNASLGPTVKREAGEASPMPTLFAVSIKSPVPVWRERICTPPPSVVLVEISKSPVVFRIRVSAAKEAGIKDNIPKTRMRVRYFWFILLYKYACPFVPSV